MRQSRVHSTTPSVQSALIDADDDGIRLDRWFKRHYPQLSHGYLEKLLRTGQVRLDGKRAKSADRVAAGQAVRVPPRVDSADAEPKPKPLSRDDIRLEDLVLY